MDIKTFLIKLLTKYVCNSQNLTKKRDNFLLKYAGQERISCPHGVFVQESKNQDNNVKTSDKRLDVTDILRFVVNATQTRELSDDEIKRAINILSNRIMILRYKNDQNEIRYFESFTKGTNRYNKKLSSKVKDFTAAVCENGTETFALTVTCDPKKYNNNRFDAWKNYTQDINKTLENLRKHKGLKYLWVKESTAKGYPHAHIVLSFPKGFCKGYDKMQNAKRLYYGEFYEYIKKNIVAPMFELQPIKGNNLKYYLTKYISKGEDDDVYRLGKKGEFLTKAERKEALAFIMTTVTKTRLCGFCKLKEMAIQNTSRTDAERLSKHLRKTGLKLMKNSSRECNERENFARLRALLIKLCNNSPFTCCKNLYTMSKNTFQKEISQDIDDEFLADKKKQQKFNVLSKRVTCNGCIWSDLVRFINGDKNSVINIKIGTNAFNNSDVYLFDYVNCDDDKEYIYAIANAIDVLQRIALLSKKDIVTSLQNEKIKKLALYQNEFIFSYVRRYCNYEDYPEYIQKEMHQKPIKKAEKRGSKNAKIDRKYWKSLFDYK